MRGLGVAEALAELVPEALVPLLVVLTQLGDPWFVMATAPLLYWLGPRWGVVSRRDGGRLLAVVVGVLALVLALKATFELPRPPASVGLIPADGFGFPSGHAAGTAAVYGAAAVLLDRPRRTVRYAAAGGAIALVSLTRLLLGVHYLVDVLVGAVLGLGFAGVVLGITDRQVDAGFWAATAFALVGLVTSGLSTGSVVAFGFALGATLAWSAVGVTTERVSVPAAAVGLLVFGGFGMAAIRLGLPRWAAWASSAIAGAGLVALPRLQNFSR